MQKKIQILPSGIPLVDEKWGGFYRGGTYLLIGSHKSGRTSLSLQFAKEAADQNEVCLFFTSARPKDLLIQAASINIDLQKYIEKNQVIVVRVASPDSTGDLYNTDGALIEYMNDIVTVAEHYQPSKIVFDELTPFIEFNDLNLLNNVFAETSEKIEDNGITTLFVLSEPVTSATQTIVDTLTEKTTGVVYLKKENEEEGHNGEMIIIPNIGHPEGQFKTAYKVEPYRGVTIDSKKQIPGFRTVRKRNVA